MSCLIGVHLKDNQHENSLTLGKNNGEFRRVNTLQTIHIYSLDLFSPHIQLRLTTIIDTSEKLHNNIVPFNFHMTYNLLLLIFVIN